MNNNMKDETYFWKYVSNNRRMNKINRCYNWINRSTHDIDFPTNKVLYFVCVGMCTILCSQKFYLKKTKVKFLSSHKCCHNTVIGKNTNEDISYC